MKSTHNGRISRGFILRQAAWRIAAICVWCALCPGIAHGECIDYGDYFHWTGYLEDETGYWDVAVSGTLAFVTGSWPAAFHVVDVSDPVFPQIMTSVDLPGDGASGVTLSEDYAYVATGGGGLQVIYVDIPAYAQLRGGVDTPGDASDVAVSGHHAYVADGDEGLQVIDVADPRLPEIIGSVDTPGTALAVAVADDYAYVADDESLQVILVADPRDPEIVASVPTPGEALDVAVSGDFVYVADGDSGLQVIDVSNPTSPQIVGTVGAMDYSSGVAANGTYCYVTSYDAVVYGWSALHVIDVSNPSSPQIVRSTASPGNARRVTVSGAQIYVAAGGWGSSGGCSDPGGLQIIKRGDPSDPLPAGGVDTPGFARDVAVAGVHAYVADGSSGLQVVDITTPSSASIVGSVPTPGQARSVAVLGDHAYVTDGNFQVINVGIPESPYIVATVDIPGSAGELAVEGTRAYVVDSVTSVQIIDISVPTMPYAMATLEKGCPWLDCDGLHVAAAGPFLYLLQTGSSWGAFYGTLEVIDVSNPSAPQVVGSRSGLSGVRALTVADGHLYVTRWNMPCLFSASTSWLSVIDVTDPASPRWATAMFAVPAGPGRIAVAGPYAYVSSGGIQVIDVETPSSLRRAGRARSRGAQGLSATADYLFIADGESGLQVYPAHCEGPPVAVPPSSFTAKLQGRAVLLSWFSCFEDTFAGFNVYRSKRLTAGYEKINDHLVAGNSLHSYLDSAVRPSTTYFYKLGAVEQSGDEVLCGPICVTTPAWGERMELRLASPSPFRRETVLNFTLAAPSEVRLAVYDVGGRLVRNLLHEDLPVGDHAATWNGRDDNGLRIAGGTYFVKLTAGDVTRTSKVVYLGGQ